MIYYPIQTLVNAGITDIMIVTGGNSAGDFLKLLGNGKAFGLKHLNYTYQEGEGGIAAALSLVEHFAGDDAICVVLGDNIIEGNIRPAADAYREQASGAKILLKRVSDPQRFGVPELNGKHVLRIEEKPAQPKSDYAVIGIYMYDARVFEIIRALKPSGRGELEITDVNNAYIERGEMTWDELWDEGWIIVGSPDTVTERLEELTEGSGAGRVVMMVDHGSAPAWMIKKNLTLFAESVMPRFREPDGKPVWARDDLRAPATAVEWAASAGEPMTPPQAEIGGVGVVDVRTAHVEELRTPLRS